MALLVAKDLDIALEEWLVEGGDVELIVHGRPTHTHNTVVENRHAAVDWERG